MTQLRIVEGLDLQLLKEKWGFDLLYQEEELVQEWLSEDLIRIENNHLRLTRHRFYGFRWDHSGVVCGLRGVNARRLEPKIDTALLSNLPLIPVSSIFVLWPWVKETMLM
jgi:hypothetical protein